MSKILGYLIETEHPFSYFLRTHRDGQHSWTHDPELARKFVDEAAALSFARGRLCDGVNVTPYRGF